MEHIRDKMKSKIAVILQNTYEEARDLARQLTDLNLFVEIKIVTVFDEFVSFIQNNDVDCFFIDLNFSQYPVVELAERLRKAQKYQKTPVIFIGDKTNDHSFLKQSTLDVDLVMIKPFTFVEFKDSLITALRKRFTKVIPEHFKVLALDNEPAILELIESHFARLQHSAIDTCKSLAEAKNAFAESEYDLLILDWNLDDGNCLDLIKYIRAKKEKIRLNNALIMVVTGRNDVDDIMMLRQHDVKDHIIKPFDYDEFEEKLRYGLERHKKARFF